MTLPKEDNFHHKKTSSKNAVVEISDSQHETLRYCPQRVKLLESESGSLYVLSFVLCPTDCNWSPCNFEQIVGHNSHTVEPEDPDSDLRSSTSVCSFKPKFLPPRFCIFMFSYTVRKTRHTKFRVSPQESKTLRYKVDMLKRQYKAFSGHHYSCTCKTDRLISLLR